MPKRRRRSGIRRTAVASKTTVLSVGKNASGDRLVQAADKLADGIREASRGIPSRKIPASVDVRPAGDDLVFVVASAPNADPVENGKRHPVFATGPRDSWHWAREPMKKVPFMEQGVSAAIDDAADVYGKTVDDWLKAVGWQ